jgi:hypothetical protein
MASLGKGALMLTSTRQKLNTRSSTETELVGADGMMPQSMWTNYFMAVQGYGLAQTIIYQDNQSAILLENNGKMSSGKRTKHANIRYYFIKDQINKKELSVEYCPTGQMTADFFTKSLQGKLFFKFRKAIMNKQDK